MFFSYNMLFAGVEERVTDCADIRPNMSELCEYSYNSLNIFQKPTKKIMKVQWIVSRIDPFLFYTCGSKSSTSGFRCWPWVACGRLKLDSRGITAVLKLCSNLFIYFLNCYSLFSFSFNTFVLVEVSYHRVRNENDLNNKGELYNPVCFTSQVFPFKYHINFIFSARSQFTGHQRTLNCCSITWWGDSITHFLITAIPGRRSKAYSNIWIGAQHSPSCCFYFPK